MTELTMSQQQKQYSIILIGDLCDDEYRYGTVDRVSTEAPVPIFNETRKTSTRGMAGNVYNNLKTLGLKADCFFGDRCSRKVRYVDERHNQQVIRIDNDNISAPIVLPGDLTMYDAIVVSDYNKGSVNVNLLNRLALIRDTPIFIDTKKTDLGSYQNSNMFFKVNEKEYRDIITIPGNLVVTLGNRGVLFNGEIYPTNKIEVSDVCGAGDTFLAAMTYQYLMTGDIKKAIGFANVAAAITVCHAGVYAPTLGEINAA